MSEEGTVYFGRELRRRVVRELRVCPSTAEDGRITQLLVEPANVLMPCLFLVVNPRCFFVRLI